ncbi:YdcF family protein [Microcoleus sp. FACHB-1515]|uniref:YdcF family protein n=1 Tax=Cyanophyceae TaxID=3028117 RepID=UPI001683A55D|nr:YdcF family protein [Microcoleus sp. FACHB-1515]MBD2092479.1 YdcF family protein [Microcoleus sp. FACHB-1515]
MFELLSRILLWLLIFGALWYIFIQFIPRVYLTWLGGLLVLSFIILAFFDPTDRTTSIVWNILSLPLRPLGLTIFLLLIALRDGVKKATGNLVLAALLVLLLSSTPIVAFWLTNQSQQTVFQSIQAQGDRPADPATVKAIVVISDNTESSFGTRSQVTTAQAGVDAAETSRLNFAAQLYREQADQGNNPLVIVSTGPPRQENDDSQSQAIRSTLTSGGVPADRILVDTNGANVRTSAVEVERLLRDRGFQGGDDIVVVASALNIRRAVSTFAQLGVDAVPRPTDLVGFPNLPNNRLLLLQDLIPSVDALALTTRVFEEYLSSIYYFLRGWLVAPGGL